MSFVSPQRLVFGALLLLLIIAGELAFGALHVPAWPAFMIMIFFFVEHMNVKKIPEILVGAVVGIASILLAGPLVAFLGPLVGTEIARLIFIALVVYAIVALGEAIPVIFNNYAFMFLTVTALAMTGPNPAPFVWMAVEVVGGSVLIAGILGIGKLMAVLAPAPVSVSATAPQ